MNRFHTLRNDRGQTMAEYAILLALVFSVVVVLIPTFGAAVVNLFNAVLAALGVQQ